MTIPDKVKVGGLIYDVRRSERLAKGDCYSAEIDYIKTVIEISNDNCEQRAQRDFLHEVVHAIYDQMGYKDHNEKEIDELAAVLYQVIVDNPDMFKQEPVK